MKCSNNHFFTVIVLLLSVLMVFGLGLHSSFCVLASDDASSKLNEAEDALQLAFVALLDAENAGANVTSLLFTLDVAGRNLTEAEMAFKSGKLIEAASKAEECLTLANDVSVEALALKRLALADARNMHWQTLLFSGVSASIFAVALVLVWVGFKRFYNEKLLDLRPEVGSSVEA